MRSVRRAVARLKNSSALLLDPSPTPSEVQAWYGYEAGRRWDPRRSYIPGYVQDAKYDGDQWSRWEILRKARYFERNSAIVNRLADLYEQYTVGPKGLKFIPNSSDPEWNSRARDFWNRWCETPDVASSMNFGAVQGVAARSAFIDGELFLVKTSGRPRADTQSFPRVQLVETHRVLTPDHLFGETAIHDGIKVDSRGRPVEYNVKTGGGLVSDEFTPYPSKDIVHIGEGSRAGQYRFFSLLAPVLNDLHDLDDLHLLEMDAAKEAAETTSIVKTKTGELSDEDLRRARFKIAGAQGTSGGSDMERSQYYSDVFRGRAKVLKHGDDYAQFNATRPSEAQAKYWDYLTGKICAGVGISKLLVFPWSMQGTVVRADLDVAATFFACRSAALAVKFTDVYHYVVGWGTQNNIGLSDPPADWRRVTVRSPRSVNVDIGRNAQALIAEYVAGWRTLESICAELGDDWEEVLIQRAEERKRARELEEQYGLQPGELIEAALEAIKANQQQTQGQAA